jgi:hypothetical protein
LGKFFRAEILGLLKSLAQQQTALEYLETILRYVSSGTDKVTKEILREEVQALFEQEEDTIMPTIAEMWMEEGRQQGEQIGWQKAQAEIEQKIKIYEEKIQAEVERKLKQVTIKNIRQTLAIRFGTPLEQYTKQLHRLKLATLEQLNELAFTVATLAEFEAKLPRPKSPKIE